MTPQPSRLVRFLSVLCLAIGIVGPPATAQAPPRLGVRSLAGLPTLSLTGTVGTVYSLQYAGDLFAPNPWVDRTLLQAQASGALWTDPTPPPSGQRFYRAVSVAAPADTNLIFIPPGSFTMGSPPDEPDRSPWEGPQTIVTISRAFWMGRYEVTQGEYLAVRGSNPSYFTGDLNRPVEQVTWFDATNYCGQLTQRERAAARIPTHWVYRLPTEAEWEYACRAGSTTRFSYGNDPGYASLTNYAWYADNGGGMTHPVGQKLPNPWGLHDLSGNVWEWCQDWSGNYPGGGVIDPQGSASSLFRAVRGGSWDGWYGTARVCRSAGRGNSGLSNENHSFGFRVVLTLGQP